MARVFMTYRIPEVGIAALREAGHEVVVREGADAIPRDELVAALREYDAVMVLLTDHIGKEEIAEAGTQLKVIANYAVGYNNIDVEAAAQRGIVVTNTPGVLNDAVAEHTFALMLALARRIPEADRFVRAGKFTGWQPNLFVSTSLIGKTLGVVGLGRIGSEVGRRAGVGLGMRVVYHDVKPNTQFEQETGATFYQNLDEMLPHIDVLSLHVPLLPETTHLITQERLARMKPSSFLVNTARGAVVDERALVEALERGVIAGAALDVYENEPALAAGLVDMANVVLTPHIASATQEAREMMADLAAKNVIAVLAGKEPLTPVVSAGRGNMLFMSGRFWAIILVLIAGVGLIMAGSVWMFSKKGPTTASAATWSFDGNAWQVNGKTLACPEPLTLPNPVDINLVTSVLYPGQNRTGGYKTHGGFRFDNSQNGDIVVTAPMDAQLTRASRYIEQGEVQYLMFFTAPCGMMYRFDHLLTLSPKWQAVIDALPPAQVDDSRTTEINPPVSVDAGEVVATGVGFQKTGNVSVDFGLYDLRKQNAISQNPTWVAQHEREKEFAFYGLCIFDFFTPEGKSQLKNLPASVNDGKVSDYCK